MRRLKENSSPIKSFLAMMKVPSIVIKADAEFFGKVLDELKSVVATKTIA